MHKLIILLSHLAGYSTANTPDAAYIIGGFVTKKIVAEFRDDQWALLDDLSKARYRQGSITVGSQTMIVGGWDPKWVMILRYYFALEDSEFFLSMETEVWELEKGNRKGITPILTNYYFGIGLYAVDFNFCSNWSLSIL